MPIQTQVIPHTIRDGRESDAQSICEVLVRSVREVCGPDYGHDEEVLSSWCANKTPENVLRWIGDPDRFLVVCEEAPRGIVGVGMYVRSTSTIELCYLAPEGLHKGLGASILKSLLAEAQRLEHREVTLISSVTARNFYTRNGFVATAEPRYWGKILGIPMKKENS